MWQPELFSCLRITSSSECSFSPQPLRVAGGKGQIRPSRRSMAIGCRRYESSSLTARVGKIGSGFPEKRGVKKSNVHMRFKCNEWCLSHFNCILKWSVDKEFWFKSWNIAKMAAVFFAVVTFSTVLCLQLRWLVSCAAARRILNEISPILQHDIMPSTHCHNMIALVAVVSRRLYKKSSSEIRQHVAGRSSQAVTAEVRPVVFPFGFVGFLPLSIFFIHSIDMWLIASFIYHIFVSAVVSLCHRFPRLMFPPTHLLPSQLKIQYLPIRSLPQPV